MPDEDDQLSDVDRKSLRILASTTKASGTNARLAERLLEDSHAPVRLGHTCTELARGGLGRVLLHFRGQNRTCVAV